MSLSQKRSRWLQNHPQNLIGFLAASFLLHGVILIESDRLLQVPPSQPRSESVMPIDYIEIPPEAATDTPPLDANYKASQASIAGGEHQPALSPSAIAPRAGAPAASELNALAPRSAASPSGQARAATPQPSQSITPQNTPPVPQSLPPNAAALPLQPTPNQPAASPSPSAETFASASSQTPSQPIASSRDAASLLQPSGNAHTNASANPDRSAANPLGVDAAQDVDLGPYLDAMKQAVQQQWVRSPAYASRRTVIEFVISRSGTISSPQVIQPSGSITVDQEAIAAIQRATPFSPLPTNYPDDAVMIHFGFTINVYGDMNLD